MEYRYLKTRGWLNEAPSASASSASTVAAAGAPEAAPQSEPPPARALWTGPVKAGPRARNLLPRAAPPGSHLHESNPPIADLGKREDGSRLIAVSDELDDTNLQRVIAEQAALHKCRVHVMRVPASMLATFVNAGEAHADPGSTLSFESDEWLAQSVTSQRELYQYDRPSSTASYPPQQGNGPSRPLRGADHVWFYTVEEGQRALMRRPNGTMEVIVGPKQVWKGRNTFSAMGHFIAHPGDFLIVRYRDGHQEHLPGPSEVWFDPRIHQQVSTGEGLQLAAKEAVVVYSTKEGTGQVQRRVVHGPALFIPRPGEWLHTFSWHASKGGSKGVIKIPNGLVFQKLWMMPDQMYHDVGDVRTADDAVLTIRLMIFFELVDINTMLDTTHDPIGDFVNAASSDVVDFVGRYDFESFKHHTEQLNELTTYKQLVGRAGQCGYRINKVVYRGYGAPDQLQQMHDQAIEARTKLQLARATERQSQELRDSKLENRLARALKRRAEQGREVDHEVALKRTRLQAELEEREALGAFERAQSKHAADEARAQAQADDCRQREHLAALRELGVDLTALLTRGRADRIIELRGNGMGASTHLHVQPGSDGDPPA
ncbi:MAG: hypothetical protein U0794_19045 [Isosphaeraceae bacterium]